MRNASGSASTEKQQENEVGVFRQLYDLNQQAEDIFKEYPAAEAKLIQRIPETTNVSIQVKGLPDGYTSDQKLVRKDGA